MLPPIGSPPYRRPLGLQIAYALAYGVLGGFILAIVASLYTLAQLANVAIQ